MSEDPECTDCGGTGLTYQTERQCSCQSGRRDRGKDDEMSDDMVEKLRQPLLCEETMRQWDIWRAAIASGSKGSWPRDAFEGLLYVIDTERMEAATRIDELAEALYQIAQWAAAYPLSVFPEPDFKKAHALLQAGGMTLDAISASNMRHVVEGVGKIARAALQEQDDAPLP